jgi:putative ABC transport system permease protein
MSFLN